MFLLIILMIATAQASKPVEKGAIILHEDVADDMSLYCEKLQNDVAISTDACEKVSIDGPTCTLVLDLDCMKQKQGQRRCDALFETRNVFYGAPCYSSYTYLPRHNKCRANSCPDTNLRSISNWIQSFLQG